MSIMPFREFVEKLNEMEDLDSRVENHQKKAKHDLTKRKQFTEKISIPKGIKNNDYIKKEYPKINKAIKDFIAKQFADFVSDYIIDVVVDGKSIRKTTHDKLNFVETLANDYLPIQNGDYPIRLQSVKYVYRPFKLGGRVISADLDIILNNKTVKK